MIVGIPREVKDNEFRVAATPEGVRELARAGHDVILEAGAGTGSALSDELFTAAGAEILPDAGAVFASRTRPARAAATISSSGRRSTSIPSSGDPSCWPPVHATNRWMYSSAKPAEV